MVRGAYAITISCAQKFELCKCKASQKQGSKVAMTPATGQLMIERAPTIDAEEDQEVVALRQVQVSHHTHIRLLPSRLPFIVFVPLRFAGGDRGMLAGNGFASRRH